MKRSELVFNVILVLVDFLVVLSAGTLAYFLRYRVETIPVLFELSYRQYLGLIIVPVLFLILLFAFFGLYTQKATRSFWREAAKVSVAVSTGLMIVVVLFFFNQQLFPSRLIVLMNWIFIIFFVISARAIMLFIQRRLLMRGTGLHRLFVVKGNGENQLIEEITHDKRLGYEIVATERYFQGIAQKIETMHRQERLDELLQVDPNLSNNEVLELVHVCEELGITFNYVPGLLETHRANIAPDVIGSVPVLRMRGTPLEGWGGVIKRVVDLFVSVVSLILFLPLIIFIAIAIKLDSKGPVFFHQPRGSSFHSFEFYKFRTMRADLSEGTPEGDRIRAELERQNVRHGPYVKIKNDPRVTRIGRILRKTKLDELPSLWHVLKGQMSLVGPRIHMVKEVEKFEDQHKRLFNTVKPGITGIAQINQVYNPELPFEEEIKLDLFYIENWSVWLDVYILFKTAVILFLRPSPGDY